MPRMRLSFLLLSLALHSLAASAEIGDSIPSNCRQLIVVTTPDWHSPRGTLRRLERERDGSPWRGIAPAHEVLLGERGLAWGIGLHELPRGAAPRKREGDRCAPAGLFALPSAFGFEPANQLDTALIPYRQITADTEAVDDPASRFYNRIVKRNQVRKPDWKSSERMATIPDYELGVVVAHNPRNVPGAGSCIFLHQWRGERAGTAGCTVLRAPHLLEVVRWLDGAKHPVLIQLPRSEMPPGF